MLNGATVGPGGERHCFTVLAAEAGARLDVWLRGRLTGYSRARLQALVREGRVRVNGEPARPSQPVRGDERVEVCVPPPRPVALRPEAMPLAILYEDADLLVLDKPPGLVVHPAAGHADGTLVNALLHHCRDLAGIGGEQRPGIVHRLDKDTSGVMVVAKHAAAMESLAAQFKAGGVSKRYTALVRGVPARSTGRVETLIGRSAHDRKKMSARPASGRPALTTWTVEERFAGAARLAVRIATGRTHQIRVHLAHIGHPVLGDCQYGRRPTVPGVAAAPRQMLHATELAFTHPRTGERVQFEAPLPPDMEAVLAALRAAPGVTGRGG